MPRINLSRGNPASSQASSASLSLSTDARKTFAPARSSAQARFSAADPSPNAWGEIDETNSIAVNLPRNPSGMAF